MPAVFEESKDTSSRSPFAGCAIFVAALLLIGFLIVFSIVVLFRQFAEIEKFTGTEPAPVELVSLEDREPELNDLAEKLEIFRLAVQGEESAVLELNAEEMNLAIAAYEPFKDLRGMLRVSGITPEAISFDMSFELNGKPRLSKKDEPGLIASNPRYLNGVMLANPGLLQQEVVLQVREIEVPGAQVPREFIEQMSPYRIAERYVGSDGIGSTMAMLTGVKLGEGLVRFEKIPGEVARDTVSNEEVNSASVRLGKFFAIAASLFLIFTGIVIFLGFRLKNRHP